MADPLGVVPGCLSLLEAISKLSDDVKAFAVDISGARKEMESLSRELNDLVPLISQVKDRSVVNNLGANLPGNMMREISDNLRTCLQVVVGLQGLLRKASMSKMKRMKWSVSTKGEAEKQRRSIQACKVALATALALNPLSGAVDVEQKPDKAISDIGRIMPSGDKDANPKRYSENKATISVRLGMLAYGPPVPKTASRTSVPSSTIQSVQSTERINSFPSPIGGNSSANSSRPFVKVLSNANRAFSSQRKLKLKNSKLVHMISATVPELEAIDLLLKGGADPNTCTDEGDSLLKLAATKDQHSVAQLLLKYGADSMKLDANGSSALEEAFCRGHAQTVHVLLHNAARLDFGYGRFGTCIQAAARGGNLELCTLVMNHGADVNSSDSGLYGNALQAAVVSRTIKVVEFLLDHGAYVNIKGGCYGSCIRAAAEMEHLEMCQLLISKGVDVNLVTCADETALLSAVIKENIGICQLLLNAGAAVTGIMMKTSWGLKGKKWDILRLLAKHGGSVDDIDVPYFGTHLQSYASRSDTEKCKMLLENFNANINVNQGHYGTALQAAVNSQSRELVQLLLDHGADPNLMGGEFGSALLAAATCGRVDLCGMLIDAGADVNAEAQSAAEDRKDIGEKGNYGSTALHAAASSGYDSLILLLLKKGSNIDREDSNGNTALHLAARNGHDVAVRLLLENGADAVARDIHGRIALHLAAAAGFETLVRLLLEKGGNVEAKDYYEETALDGAVRNKHNAVVQLFVTAKDANGRTALHRAAAGGNLILVQRLLENGSDIDAKDSYDETVLDGAIRNKQDAVVQLLVTATDVHGMTALHRAAAAGHLSLVRRLLENGSDIDAKDSYDETALAGAIRNKHDTVVQLLVTATDVHGRTALHRASIGGHESLVQLLLESGSDINTKDSNGDIALNLAARNGHDRLVQLLLEKGANITMVNKNGRAALHEAAARGNESLVQLLLEGGSSINMKDSRGDSALDSAAANGHDAVVKVLLQNGADLGYCADAMLRSAIRMSDFELVKVLLERGANANATDGRGQTVLQLALLRGRANIVQILRSHGANTTMDPHFQSIWAGLPPSFSERTWRACTTNPEVLAWD